MSQSGGHSSTIASESQRLYAAADALGQAISLRVADWDRNQELHRGAFAEAAAIGLTGIEVPKYLGGLGLGFRQKVKVAEILSRYSMAFAFSVINTQNVASRLAEIGSASHKRDLLPELLAGRRVGSTALTEPGAGSDFGAISTHAQQHGTQWLLNGEKAWITNAAVSDVIICYTQTDPDAGSRGIASFLIDGRRSGFHRLPPYRLTGSHLIGTGGFRLENYRAETDDLLAAPGEGFRTALDGVNGARVYVAALCCAMVHSSLVTATQYGSERKTFGRTLLQHQGLAWSLASVANKLEAARLLTDRAIDLMESDNDGEIILAAAHAKKFATEMAEPAITACIQAMGAEGLRDQYPLGRHLADARVANFVDGSTEIQTERIARSLAKVYQHTTYEAPPPQPFAPPTNAEPSDWAPPQAPGVVTNGEQVVATQDSNHEDSNYEDTRHEDSENEDTNHQETVDGLVDNEDTVERPASGWFGDGSPEAAATATDEVIDSPPPMPPGGPPLPPDSLRTE